MFTYICIVCPSASCNLNKTYTYTQALAYSTQDLSQSMKKCRLSDWLKIYIFHTLRTGLSRILPLFTCLAVGTSQRHAGSTCLHIKFGERAVTDVSRSRVELYASSSVEAWVGLTLVDVCKVHYELFVDQSVIKNVKICRLLVLPLEVQVTYRSSHF